MKTLLITIIMFTAVLSKAQDVPQVSVSAINNDMLIIRNNKDSENFEKYQKILVVQMEGKTAVSGKVDSTSKTPSFKEIARKYIVVTITDVEFSDGIVTAVKISRNLQNSFFINGNASVKFSRVYSSWTW